MNHKRNFLVVITALILVCAIPISASARGNFSYSDSDMLTYTYDGASMSAVESPGYHIVCSDYEIISKMHTTSGAYYSFVLWIPFQGYFFVVVQNNTYPTDCVVTSFGTRNAFYWIIKSDTSLGGNLGTYYNGYSAFDGLYGLNDGTTYSGLHVIFGHYVSIVKIPKVNNESNLVYTASRYKLPDENLGKAITDEMDRIYNDVYNVPNAGAQIIPGIGDAASEELTLPDGSPVPTNEHGNPAPTNEWGETVPTLENGKPVPTYPNGKPVQHYYDSSGNMHTVPYDEVNGEAYPTVHNPDGTVDIVTTTVINNGEVESDARENFSKLRMWVTSLDLFETLASSVYDDVSDKVDDTRGLIDNVFSWFPVWLPAVIMLGMVVILAIKIIGR